MNFMLLSEKKKKKKKKKIKHQVRFINNNLKENLIDTYENEEELVEER